MAKTPDEIKKGLEKCCDSPLCVECPYYPDDDCQQLEFEALAYIQQLEAQTPKWISVDDRLPEFNELVLVWRANINEMDVFDGRFVQIRCETAEMRRIHGITHWMPLPEAPKERGYEYGYNV